VLAVYSHTWKFDFAAVQRQSSAICAVPQCLRCFLPLQSLSAEGKSKKAAEHAAAAAALNHLRDVGLLKVPAPAARACTARAAPPPQAPQPPHYRMGDMGFATHPQSYGAGGTNPWASPDSRYTGGAPPLRTRSPALQPDARSYGKQFPSGVEPVEVSKVRYMSCHCDPLFNLYG